MQSTEYEVFLKVSQRNDAPLSISLTFSCWLRQTLKFELEQPSRLRVMDLVPAVDPEFYTLFCPQMHNPASGATSAAPIRRDPIPALSVKVRAERSLLTRLPATPWLLPPTAFRRCHSSLAPSHGGFASLCGRNACIGDRRLRQESSWCNGGQARRTHPSSCSLLRNR